MTLIQKTFERPAPGLVAGLAKFGTATLHEAQGRRGALDSRIKPIYPGMRACGPALTAVCHAVDNLMIFAAISIAQPGDVLVVSAGNQTEQGGFGEVLATACMAKGIVALVTDAGVRDGAAVRDRGFNVFCLGLSVKGTVKETLGAVNHSVIIGGILINPGDIVCADDDGVVVVAKADAAEAARQSEQREDKEAKLMKALEAGGDILELTGMGAVLEKKGASFL